MNGLIGLCLKRKQGLTGDFQSMPLADKPFLRKRFMDDSLPEERYPSVIDKHRKHDFFYV